MSETNPLPPDADVVDPEEDAVGEDAVDEGRPADRSDVDDRSKPQGGRV